MDDIYSILNSPTVSRTMYNLAIVSMMLAFGMILVGFAFYGRAREAEEAEAAQERWILLMSTWRDSLILTMLFVGQSLVYRYSEFMGVSAIGTTSILELPFLISPIVLLVFDILIFTIAAMRIIAITRWLKKSSVNHE